MHLKRPAIASALLSGFICDERIGRISFAALELRWVLAQAHEVSMARGGRQAHKFIIGPTHYGEPDTDFAQPPPAVREGCPLRR
jgi:hypothetical protein